MPYIPVFTEEELESLDYYDALFLKNLDSLPGITAIYEALDYYLDPSGRLKCKEQKR